MSQSILLCDQQWQIVKVLESDGAPPFREGESLTERTGEADKLQAAAETLDSRKQSVLTLHMDGGAEETTVLIHTYPKYKLVFLVCVENAAEFVRFANDYVRTLAWADENVQVPFSDEYFYIEQMNNQLVNAKRALTKSNIKLQRLLAQVREANSAIAVLEREGPNGGKPADGLRFYRGGYLAFQAGQRDFRPGGRRPHAQKHGDDAAGYGACGGSADRARRRGYVLHHGREQREGL